MPGNPGPLDGLRVLEWALDTPGSYCTKLLGDLGADVIKVEEPEGDPVRNLGPFPGDVSGLERSAFFLFLNTNKRGVKLDLRTKAGRSVFDGLVRDTDILVTDSLAPDLDARGLSFEALSDVNPRLIYTPITPFGLTGPYRDYKTTDLISFHMSGLGHATPGFISDYEAEPPLRTGGRQADATAGLTAAAATVFAILTRAETGRGQLVDVSRLEPITAYNLAALSEYCFKGEAPHRAAGLRLLRLQCKDGLVNPVIGLERWWASFVEILGNPEWAKDYMDRGARNRDWEKVEKLIVAQTSQWTKAKVTELCQEKRIPCEPIYGIDEVVNSRQLAAREFFVPVIHPVLGDVTLPRNPLILSETPPSLRRTAPLFGEHTAEVLEERLGLSDADMERIETHSDESWQPNSAPPPVQPQAGGNGQTKKLPLEGLRVADFTWVIAGPLCARYLASMGAEVIKIESQARNDSPATAPNNLVYSKKAALFNLSKEEGRELCQRFLAGCDIVVENYGKGVMDRLGLGYEQLKDINPGLIYASSSGFGRTGPESEHVVYGQNLHAYSGLVSVTGYVGGEPRGLSATFTDPITAITELLGILSALHYRRSNGKGQFIDVSMIEATVAQLPEAVLDYVVNGRVWGCMGNEDVAMAPHNVYRCAGDDAWIAIAVGWEEEWKGFCAALQRPAWCTDPRFASQTSRFENRRELDRYIEEWTRKGDRLEMMHLLQRHGVPAGAVYDAKEVVEDPHLKQRGLFVEIDEPRYGKLRYIGQPWHLTPDGGGYYVPSSVMGADSEYVYKTLLGCSDAEYDRLVEEQVVS